MHNVIVGVVVRKLPSESYREIKRIDKRSQVVKREAKFTVSSDRRVLICHWYHRPGIKISPKRPTVNRKPKGKFAYQWQPGSLKELSNQIMYKIDGENTVAVERQITNRVKTPPRHKQSIAVIDRKEPLWRQQTIRQSQL